MVCNKAVSSLGDSHLLPDPENVFPQLLIAAPKSPHIPRTVSSGRSFSQRRAPVSARAPRPELLS